MVRSTHSKSGRERRWGGRGRLKGKSSKVWVRLNLCGKDHRKWMQQCFWMKCIWMRAEEEGKEAEKKGKEDRFQKWKGKKSKWVNCTSLWFKRCLSGWARDVTQSSRAPEECSVSKRRMAKVMVCSWWRMMMMGDYGWLWVSMMTMAMVKKMTVVNDGWMCVYVCVCDRSMWTKCACSLANGNRMDCGPWWFEND